MKCGSSFTDTFKNKCKYFLSGYIQIWHFYCTLSRGLLFPGHSIFFASVSCCILNHWLLNHLLCHFSLYVSVLIEV